MHDVLLEAGLTTGYTEDGMASLLGKFAVRECADRQLALYSSSQPWTQAYLSSVQYGVINII